MRLSFIAVALVAMFCAALAYNYRAQPGSRTPSVNVAKPSFDGSPCELDAEKAAVDYCFEDIEIVQPIHVRFEYQSGHELSNIYLNGEKAPHQVWERCEILHRYGHFVVRDPHKKIAADEHRLEFALHTSNNPTW